MRLLSIVLLLASTQASLWADGSAKLRMDLQFPRTEFIAGEPVEGRVTLENIGDTAIIYIFYLSPYSNAVTLKMEGPVNPKCKAAQRFVEIGGHKGPYPELGPAQKGAPWPIRLKDWGAVAAGDYEVWAEYDSQIPEEGVERSQLTPIKSESNHVRLRILPPTGEDARAFNEHHDACNQLTLTPAEVLKSFPSSTYAVYALAQHYGLKGGAIPLDTARTRVYLAELQKNGAETLKDKTRHFACGPDGSELHDTKGDHIPITVEQYLRDSIAQAETICSRHPGFGLCDQIRFNVIAYDYLELLQFQDAASAFRSLQQETTDQQLRENCGKMLEVLKEIGLDGSGDSKEPAAPAKDK